MLTLVEPDFVDLAAPLALGEVAYQVDDDVDILLGGFAGYATVELEGLAVSSLPPPT